MIGGTTRVVGIFGENIGYTLSPLMHNHAFAKLGLDFIYVPFEVRREQLKEAVGAIRKLGIAGVNVTIPHKEAVLPLLDRLSPLAKKIGAVNTIVNRNGKLFGENTDAPGFIESLIKDGSIDPKKKRVVLIGAGGAARAIAVALATAGVSKIAIINRTMEKAKKLSEMINKLDLKKMECYTVSWSDRNLKKEIAGCNLLVNATPADNELIKRSVRQALTKNLFVFDAVYSKSSFLVNAAKKAGAPALTGMGMLIRQGALSFSLWTGKKPPVKIMQNALGFAI